MMKVYNKKGLAWGVFWTILGAARLILLVTHPEDGAGDVVKGVLVGVFMLAVGLTGFTRAFSKQATLEDRVEENDERNTLLKLKTKARLCDVLFLGFLAFIAIGGVAYMQTDNIAWAFWVFVPCLFLIIYFIAGLFCAFYYNKRL
ncbi:MAG: hypothetical protein UDB11_05510 [Peptococcaceae bacterium]|nr:hypothetical protein [Peptococcaceae bacterium]